MAQHPLLSSSALVDALNWPSGLSTQNSSVPSRLLFRSLSASAKDLAPPTAPCSKALAPTLPHPQCTVGLCSPIAQPQREETERTFGPRGPAGGFSLDISWIM